MPISSWRQSVSFLFIFNLPSSYLQYFHNYWEMMNYIFYTCTYISRKKVTQARGGKKPVSYLSLLYLYTSWQMGTDYSVIRSHNYHKHFIETLSTCSSTETHPFLLLFNEQVWERYFSLQHTSLIQNAKLELTITRTSRETEENTKISSKLVINTWVIFCGKTLSKILSWYLLYVYTSF